MRAVTLAVAATGLSAAIAFGQSDARQTLRDARQALGGGRLETLKTLTATGRSVRPGPTGGSMEGDFEMALELPDKFVRRDVVAALGNASIYRVSGFNGDGVINETDTPPQLSAGNVVTHARMGGPGGDPATMTPEQKEAARLAQLHTARRDFTRIALGMLVTLPSYPVTFTAGGTAESPEGTADVVEVKAEGFAGRLFIDTRTHLPLMLSWMNKEPLQRVIQMGGPGGARSAPAAAGGNVVTMQRGGAGGGGPQGTKPPAQMTPEERAQFEQRVAEQMKEMEAKRRTVEYRIYYADYKAVDGVMLPHRLQSSVDGKPTEEISLEKVRVNQKIDPRRFTVSK